LDTAFEEEGLCIVRGPDLAWGGDIRRFRCQPKLQLEAVQAGLGRAEATRAALIPITKSPAWWDLPRDERRAIFEERFHHISASLKYLPDRTAALPLARDRRAVRFPHLVRVRARARRPLR